MTSEQRPPVNNGHYFFGPEGGLCTKVWLYFCFLIFRSLFFKCSTDQLFFSNWQLQLFIWCWCCYCYCCCCNDILLSNFCVVVVVFCCSISAFYLVIMLGGLVLVSSTFLLLFQMPQKLLTSTSKGVKSDLKTTFLQCKRKST
jgi:hypothetical protein